MKMRSPIASGSSRPLSSATLLYGAPSAVLPLISYQNFVTARSVGTVKATATLPAVDAASAMTVSGTSRLIG